VFLKSLDIFGFKSFADKTRIEFADGITALLGPNGCGKSNVVDAIKWVLGEQRSKSMRAESMEDVIFNGTEARKALNVAEVTLTLANDAGLLPLDMPEVEIKRRLFRSGENEYFINAQPVRLRDIRELFWDTGVGKAAYSVMEQGKIDQALSSKPEERRYLFEEAAGITKYKEKGLEAARKLAAYEENIRQQDGILREVKHSYDSLKVQSEKTAKYRALKDEVFQFELDIQLLRLKQFKYERDERNEHLKKQTEERDKLRTDLDTTNKSLEENMDVVNSMEAELIEYQKNIFGLAKEKNGLENEARLLVERREENKNQIAQNESRERAIGIKVEELGEDASEQDGVVRDLQKKVAGIEENIGAFEKNIELASSRIGENDHAIQNADGEIGRLEEIRASREQELESITDDIVAALDSGLKEAGYSAADRKKREAALEEGIARLETLLGGRETLLRDLATAAERAIGEGAALSPAEVRRLAETLAASLAGADTQAGALRGLFADYRQSVPTFIDDFLAPEGIITQKRSIDNQIRNAKEAVVRQRGLIVSLRGSNEDLLVKIGEYRGTLEEMRVSRAAMKAQTEAAQEQARLIRRELAGQEAQLKTVSDELFLARKRFNEINERISDAEQQLAEIEAKGHELAANLEKLEKDIQKRNGDVAGKRETLRKQTDVLARANTGIERLHLELVQAETEIRNIQDNFRETHSRDLLEFEARMFEIKAGRAELVESLGIHRTALKDLGPVNLMAVEEFAEVKERHDHLVFQLEDCVKARDDIEKITAEIRAISSEKFLEAYNKIKKNFHNMFRRIFGGGRAELRLSDPNHVLESGIEIFAQPPGKKLENIALLSGGEKSMTAVALLFATYMVKPSPFCVLDEIDAALDEDNVSRFVQLLREFSNRSQFVVITHNKKTVTGASTLLGITMEESGVTKTITIRLQNEEKARQDLPPETVPFVEEDVEAEEGRELPEGIDDPASVSDADLRPIRSGLTAMA
jgi:chromosome segregation protein